MNYEVFFQNIRKRLFKIGEDSINLQEAGCEDVNYIYLEMAQDSISWKNFIHSVMSYRVSRRSDVFEHVKILSTETLMIQHFNCLCTVLF